MPVSLTSGNGFEVLGIHDKHFHVPFQHIKNRFPEAAGTFHGDVGHAQTLKPLPHLKQIGHHGAKRPPLFLALSLLIGSNGAHDHVSLVNVNTRASLIHTVHGFPPRMTKMVHRRATGRQAWVKFSPTCFPMPGATDGGACVASRSHCWSGSQHEYQADL
jgi:hypothetical protein